MRGWTNYCGPPTSRLCISHGAADTPPPRGSAWAAPAARLRTPLHPGALRACREAVFRTMADVIRHASELDELDPAAENLGRTWTREELYDEHLAWPRTRSASS